MIGDFLESADAFLRTGDHFHLGHLPTEQPHPETLRLSQINAFDTGSALKLLQKADIQALQMWEAAEPDLDALADAIREQLLRGGRIFISGCGATGRLAITLETLVREGAFPGWTGPPPIAFMAGGDAALVRSLEGFEDLLELGARQLEELGFGEDDLLIAVTEGGETPWVIGTVLDARRLSHVSPWFLCCNPESLLMKTVGRSREVLVNPEIHNICFEIGNMAITGSTRMQASTVLLAAIGFAIRQACGGLAWRNSLRGFQQVLQATEYEKMAELTRRETESYFKKEGVMYTTSDYGVTVLTDTTERSPTFSLTPFENVDDPDDWISICFLMIPDSINAQAAWEQLLKRPVRTLEWKSVADKTGSGRLFGFDVSSRAIEYRYPFFAHSGQQLFQIHRRKAGIEMQFCGIEICLPVDTEDYLLDNLLLKVVLNAHSTLVMTGIGRVEGNLMTFVRASNGKLIDRAARYVQYLSQQRYGRDCSYENAVRAVFAVKESLSPTDSVVEAALSRLVKDGMTQ